MQLTKLISAHLIFDRYISLPLLLKFMLHKYDYSMLMWMILSKLIALFRSIEISYMEVMANVYIAIIAREFHLYVI